MRFAENLSDRQGAEAGRAQRPATSCPCSQCFAATFTTSVTVMAATMPKLHASILSCLLPGRPLMVKHHLLTSGPWQIKSAHALAYCQYSAVGNRAATPAPPRAAASRAALPPPGA